MLWNKKLKKFKVNKFKQFITKLQTLIVLMKKEILWCCGVKALIEQRISLNNNKTNTKNYKSKIY